MSEHETSEGSARRTLRTIALLLQANTRPRCEMHCGQRRIVYPARDMLLDLIEAELGEKFPDLALEIEPRALGDKTRHFDRVWDAFQCR